MINTLLSARKLQSVSTVEEQRLNNDGRLIRLDYVFRKTAPAARSNIISLGQNRYAVGARAGSGTSLDPSRLHIRKLLSTEHNVVAKQTFCL
jgi:hypothetical protein